jgi:hypothetical protein
MIINKETLKLYAVFFIFNIRKDQLLKPGPSRGGGGRELPRGSGGL